MSDAAPTPLELLQQWLGRQLDPTARAWLSATHDKLAGEHSDRDLYMAVSLATRKIGKVDLALCEADLAAADAARAGWSPTGWSADQAARLAIILGASVDPERFAARLDQLFRTADVGELVAFYRGLCLYPKPEAYVARAAEGARSNMKAVFEAVAHRNPYPREQFDEGTWNHLVLKALFVGSRLHPIDGLDERQNADLTRMLCDYAHERWAASRTISIELWRCVCRYADDAAIDDLARVISSEDPNERRAGALALAASPHSRAGDLLGTVPEIAAEIETGDLTWTSVVQRAGL